MRDVFLDTNFLTLPHMFKVDVFEEVGRLVPEEHRLYTTTGVVGELESLARGGGELAAAARVALRLLGQKGVVVVADDKPVDEALFGRVRENNSVIVCTSDRNLKRKLIKSGAEVISLRGKNRIMRI